MEPSFEKLDSMKDHLCLDEKDIYSSDSDPGNLSEEENKDEEENKHYNRCTKAQFNEVHPVLEVQDAFFVELQKKGINLLNADKVSQLNIESLKEYDESWVSTHMDPEVSK